MENRCNENHPIQHVLSKFEDQKQYLPPDMVSSFENFFQGDHTQEILNDVFHLLKKYDLASEEEKEHRNHRLNMVLHNL